MSWKSSIWDEVCCPLQEDGCFPPYMDARHVELIYKIAMSGLFKNILEIGSWNGFSTSAFVSALQSNADFELTVCDIDIRPRLLQVLDRSPRPVLCRKAKSIEVIDKKYDLILVDGDHRLSVVAEEIEALMRCNTPSIIAHDTSACVPWFDGSRHLANVFRYHTSYESLEDSEKRSGEWTERGLFFASRMPHTFTVVQKIWEGHFFDRA